MKHKKFLLKNIIVILLLIVSLLFINTKYTYAKSLSDTIEGADEFIQSGVSDTNTTIEDEELIAMSDLLYNALLIIAIITAVIVGLVIGIQFMTGSVEQKAKVKETLIPYIAGCIVVFGAFTIWKLVVEILGEV